MPKNIRQTLGQNVYDPSNIEALQFNPAAGSKKVSEVGRSLLPLKVPGNPVTYSTDASTTVRILDFPGKCLAVYNNAGAVGAVTLGTDPAVTVALAAGVTDANGNVGIPCAPNSWTYIACGSKQCIKSTAATLLIFEIEDDTNIKQEAKY